MSKKSAAAGNSEAIRIYERMEEERKQKVQAKAEANKPKKVTLPAKSYAVHHATISRLSSPWAA
jgi:hypothetical protein